MRTGFNSVEESHNSVRQLQIDDPHVCLLEGG